MHSALKHWSMSSASWIEMDALLAEFTDRVRREGLDEYRVTGRVARHFLAWLELSDLALEKVNATVISQFLQHDCECFNDAPTAVKLRPWRKRRSSPDLIRFVRFLEQKGIIPVPGDLDSNLQLLEQHLAQMRSAGYSDKAMKNCRASCISLFIWLHFSRIRLCKLTPQALKQFRKRRFICSIPGLYAGHTWRTSSRADWSGLRGFLKHLADTGMIQPLSPVMTDTAAPQCIDRFETWLVRYRYLSASTVNRHTRLITMLVPDLGMDPGIYDAALIRRVFFIHIDNRSSDYAATLASTLRMYLRFLVSEGAVSQALIAAVPRVPKWSLAALPQYISAADMERTIASCDDRPAGIRDRTILLLLARLALRASDITALRIGDIDWNRAEIRVSGKSRRQTALPLPQEVGDALYLYLMKARRTIDGLPLKEQKVFLGSLAPYRPFNAASTVTSIVRRALNRAGVVTRGGRGAHVFRHSQATALVRAGASFEVISSLLRHASMDTTMIYAKADTRMLREVAQPWLGGGDS